MGETTEPKSEFARAKTPCATALTGWTTSHSRAMAMRLIWRGAVSLRTSSRIAFPIHCGSMAAGLFVGTNIGVPWASAGTLLDPEFADRAAIFHSGAFWIFRASRRRAERPHFGIATIYHRKVGSGGEASSTCRCIWACPWKPAMRGRRATTSVRIAAHRREPVFGLDTFSVR